MYRNTNNDYLNENNGYYSQRTTEDEDYYSQLGNMSTTTTRTVPEQINYRNYTRNNNNYRNHRRYYRNQSTSATANNDDDDERPLLDELEIYPKRIIEKSLAILNPFHAHGLSDNAEYLFHDNDLAGPILFFCIFAFCLILTGHQTNFSYIYGLSVISITIMYFLITLMCNSTKHFISLSGVASILGYSILPIVWIGIFGIFIQLKSVFGVLLIAMSVTLSTKGSSKTFCLMINEPEQRYLIGYPCALLYMIFSLLLVF